MAQGESGTQAPCCHLLLLKTSKPCPGSLARTCIVAASGRVEGRGAQGGGDFSAQARDGMSHPHSLPWVGLHPCKEDWEIESCMSSLVLATLILRLSIGTIQMKRTEEPLS